MAIECIRTIHEFVVIAAFPATISEHVQTQFHMHNEPRLVKLISVNAWHFHEIPIPTNNCNPGTMIFQPNVVTTFSPYSLLPSFHLGTSLSNYGLFK